MTAARRTRPVLALLASALLVCAGLVAGTGEPVPPGTARPATSLLGGLGGCVPTGPRRSVEDLNQFVASAAGVPEFLGADVGVDVPLRRGGSLWLFADTLQSASPEGPFVRNSMLLFSPGCAQVVLAHVRVADHPR